MEDSHVEYDRDRFRKRSLLLIAFVVTGVFLAVVWPFLVAVLMAAIIAGMSHPIYEWVRTKLKGRGRMASAITVIGILLLIVLPAIAFFTLVAAQAVQVANSARPWIEQQVTRPGAIEDMLARLPFLDRLTFLEDILPDRERLMATLGDAAGVAGSFLVSGLASFTRGTLNLVLQLFILLYALYFFLLDGRKTLDRMLYFLPLSSEDEELLVSRFVSVTRATLKGSLVIGVLQGGLAGVAFALAGIEGAAFWGTVMMVLSVIPGVGAALVWIPAVLFLLFTGPAVPGLLLAAWCAVVVGTIDNVLRPRLVGRDTKMSDLMILLSTLGGIILFGVVGFILGPIVAAVFVTVWDLFGKAFADTLPASRAVL